MSFVLDTDICSAYIKGHKAVAARFIQYGGRLYVSTTTLGELYTLDHGFSAGDIDLFNAATALVEGFHMVTHNTKDYVNVPGLTVIDWLGP